MITTETKLNQIIEELINNKTIRFNSNSFYTNKTGVVLCLFYYNLATASTEINDLAFKLLEEEIIKFRSSPNMESPQIAKIGWFLSHLRNSGFIELNLDDFDESINEHLFQNMINYLRNNNYDLFTGAIGIVMYYINIGIDNILLKKYLTGFIEELYNKADRCSSGEIKWSSYLGDNKKTKVYNISMSHGIASIIVVLCKIYKLNIHKEKTKYLIEGAVTYILNQKLPFGKHVSIFPTIALESLDELQSSRLAWCYGDLGIAISLWHASITLNRNDWETESIKTILHSASRRDLKRNGIVDTSLCHGTAGIAHIFSRMYRYTGLKELNEASTYWSQRTVRMATFDNGLAGFKTFKGNDQTWVNDASFLEGVSGTALAMVSHLHKTKLDWDEFLLLS